MTTPHQVLSNAIADGAFPGAAFFYRASGQETRGYVGRQTYCPDSPVVDEHTIWDLASVSKVISTTTLVLMAVQSGQLDLDSPVTRIIPEFGVSGKEKITFRNLMVHNSGLIAFRAYYKTCRTRSEVLEKIYQEQLTYSTGSKTVYSDLSMILMDEALTRALGKPLDELFRKNIAEPLGLSQTGYFRLGASTSILSMNPKNCAPTERTEDWRRTMRRLRHGDVGSVRLYGNDPEYIQGEVHDPTATAIGGVAGHAGLFANLNDLIKFLTDFSSPKPKFFDRRLRDEFTTKQSAESSRALGWDTKSPTGSSAGNLMGPKSYGHTGYTGTSVWIDPEANSFAILLTNHVHPTSENSKIQAVRPQFHDAAFGSS